MWIEIPRHPITDFVYPGFLWNRVCVCVRVCEVEKCCNYHCKTCLCVVKMRARYRARNLLSHTLSDHKMYKHWGRQFRIPLCILCGKHRTHECIGRVCFGRAQRGDWLRCYFFLFWLRLLIIVVVTTWLLNTWNLQISCDLHVMWSPQGRYTKIHDLVYTIRMS